jgi:hypothetical protein
MSVVMNGSAPGRFLYGRGGEPRRLEGVMAASEVLFNDDGYGESKQWGGFGSMRKGRGDGGVGFWLGRGGVQEGRLASAWHIGQERCYLASGGRRRQGAGPELG